MISPETRLEDDLGGGQICGHLSPDSIIWVLVLLEFALQPSPIYSLLWITSLDNKEACLCRIPCHMGERAESHQMFVKSGFIHLEYAVAPTPFCFYQFLPSICRHYENLAVEIIKWSVLKTTFNHLISLIPAVSHHKWKMIDVTCAACSWSSPQNHTSFFLREKTVNSYSEKPWTFHRKCFIWFPGQYKHQRQVLHFVIFLLVVLFSVCTHSPHSVKSN